MALASRSSTVSPAPSVSGPHGAPSTVSAWGYLYGTAGWSFSHSASWTSFLAWSARQAVGPSANSNLSSSAFATRSSATTNAGTRTRRPRPSTRVSERPASGRAGGTRLRYQHSLEAEQLTDLDDVVLGALERRDLRLHELFRNALRGRRTGHRALVHQRLGGVACRHELHGDVP